MSSTVIEMDLCLKPTGHVLVAKETETGGKDVASPLQVICPGWAGNNDPEDHTVTNSCYRTI